MIITALFAIIGKSDIYPITFELRNPPKNYVILHLQQIFNFQYLTSQNKQYTTKARFSSSVLTPVLTLGWFAGSLRSFDRVRQMSLQQKLRLNKDIHHIPRFVSLFYLTSYILNMYSELPTKFQRKCQGSLQNSDLPMFFTTPQSNHYLLTYIGFVGLSFNS